MRTSLENDDLRHQTALAAEHLQIRARTINRYAEDLRSLPKQRRIAILGDKRLAHSRLEQTASFLELLAQDLDLIARGLSNEARSTTIIEPTSVSLWARLGRHKSKAAAVTAAAVLSIYGGTAEAAGGDIYNSSKSIFSDFLSSDRELERLEKAADDLCKPRSAPSDQVEGGASGSPTRSRIGEQEADEDPATDGMELQLDEHDFLLFKEVQEDRRLTSGEIGDDAVRIYDFLWRREMNGDRIVFLNPNPTPPSDGVEFIELSSLSEAGIRDASTPDTRDKDTYRAPLSIGLNRSTARTLDQLSNEARQEPRDVLEAAVRTYIRVSLKTQDKDVRMLVIDPAARPTEVVLF